MVPNLKHLKIYVLSLKLIKSTLALLLFPQIAINTPCSPFTGSWLKCYLLRRASELASVHMATPRMQLPESVLFILGRHSFLLLVGSSFPTLFVQSGHNKYLLIKRVLLCDMCGFLFK